MRLQTRRLPPLVLLLSFLMMSTSSSVRTVARIEGTSRGDQRVCSGVSAKVLPSFRWSKSIGFACPLVISSLARRAAATSWGCVRLNRSSQANSSCKSARYLRRCSTTWSCTVSGRDSSIFATVAIAVDDIVKTPFQNGLFVSRALILLPHCDFNKRANRSVSGPARSGQRSHYSTSRFVCFCCILSQKPSLQSITTTARHPRGKARRTASTIVPPYPRTADVISKKWTSFELKSIIKDTPTAVGCPGLVMGSLTRPLVASLEACRKSGSILMNWMAPVCAKFSAMLLTTGWSALTFFETLIWATPCGIPRLFGTAVAII